MRLRSRSRLPITAISRLLKSCATPPVSWPIVSIFCAWRNCSCAFSRAATSFIRSAVRCSTRCSRVAVSSASAVRSAASCASRFSRSISAVLRAVMSEQTPTSDLMLPSAPRTARRAHIDPVLRAVRPDHAVFDAVVPSGLGWPVQCLSAFAPDRRDEPHASKILIGEGFAGLRPKNCLQVSDASSSKSGRCNSSAPRWPAFNAVCSRPSLSVRSRQNGAGLILATPAADRGADDADQRGRMKRPFDEGDVAERLPEPRRIRIALGTAALMRQQHDRKIRPRRLSS